MNVACGGEAAGLEPGVQPGLEIVMTRHFCALSRFPFEPHPETTLMQEDVLDAHGRRRADARERIDHQRNQRPVTQAGERGHADAVQQRPRLVEAQDRRLAALDDMLRPAHGSGGIERQHAAGRETVEQVADRGQMTLDRRRRMALAEPLDIGGDLNRRDRRHRDDPGACTRQGTRARRRRRRGG